MNRHSCTPVNLENFDLNLCNETIAKYTFGNMHLLFHKCPISFKLTSLYRLIYRPPYCRCHSQDSDFHAAGFHFQLVKLAQNPNQHFPEHHKIVNRRTKNIRIKQAKDNNTIWKQTDILHYSNKIQNNNKYANTCCFS